MFPSLDYQTKTFRKEFDQQPKKNIRLRPDDQEEYRIIVASDRQTRERAYRLAYQVYQKEGYITPSKSKMLVAPYDANPETITLLAEDMHGNDIGTISVVFDRDNKLPCDELYSEEMDQLRYQNRQTAEIVRFAVDKTQEHSKTVLLRLFNFVLIHALKMKSCTDFVIEVNPHHVDYYLKMLLFEKIGPERSCSRVKGAPAVLLRLDLSLVEDEIEMVAGSYGAKRSHRGRSIYSYAYTKEEEQEVIDFLEASSHSMSQADAIYFGLISPIFIGSHRFQFREKRVPTGDRIFFGALAKTKSLRGPAIQNFGRISFKFHMPTAPPLHA